MTPRTGRLLALAMGLLSGGGAYAAYPHPLLAANVGAFWLAAGLLARRNESLIRQRGNRWAGAQGGLSALAVSAAYLVATSLSLPTGFGFALALFVLGVSYAMAGVGVEMANAHPGADADDSAPGADANAVPDGDDGAAAGR